MRASQAQERLKRLREDDGDQLLIEDVKEVVERKIAASGPVMSQGTPVSGSSNYESEREEEDRRDDSMSTRSDNRGSGSRPRAPSRWVRTASEGGESLAIQY